MGETIQLRYSGAMTHVHGMQRLTPDRLSSLLKERKMSPEELSGRIGKSRSYIRKFMQGVFKIENIDVLGEISRVLGISTVELLGIPAPPADGRNSPQSTAVDYGPAGYSMRPLHVRWRAQAGAWLEVDHDQSEIEEHLVPVSMDYPNVSRFLARVYGDSMNKTPLQDGAIAICLDFQELGKPPMDGMIVLVQRTEDGGATIETTVKRLHVFNDRCELRPESTNPQHETIIVKRGEGEDGEVKIIGLVDGVYYPRRALL